MRTGGIVAGVVIALLLGVAGGYALGTSRQDQELESAKALAERLEEIYDGPDGTEKLSGLMELYADTAVIDDAAANDHFEGESQLEWANMTFLSTRDLDMRVEQTIPSENALVMVWTATGKDSTPDGFVLPGVTIYELDGDRVVHETYYYDMSAGPQ